MSFPKWRMDVECDNCPFATSGPGKQLGDSLRPGRWREILRSLRKEQSFPCHKTVSYEEDSDGTCTNQTRVCAGAIAWQKRHGIFPQWLQVMERLAAAHRMGLFTTNTRGARHHGN